MRFPNIKQDIKMTYNFRHVNYTFCYLSGQAREVDLKLEMGQASEKLYTSDEKCKNLEKERDDLKRRYVNNFSFIKPKSFCNPFEPLRYAIYYSQFIILNFFDLKG